jgi:hypothetical protein
MTNLQIKASLTEAVEYANKQKWNRLIISDETENTLTISENGNHTTFEFKVVLNPFSCEEIFDNPAISWDAKYTDIKKLCNRIKYLNPDF